jgi:voltage-gated potassium channel Kch
MGETWTWFSRQGVVLFRLLSIIVGMALPLVVPKELLPSTLYLTFVIVSYGLGWIFTLALSIDGLAYLYGFQLPGRVSDKFTWESSSVQTPAGAIGSVLLSFFMTLYGYALIYIFLSHQDTKAFSCGPLGIVDATYFTVVTAATVGYGDIIPVSPGARLVVTSQILMTFLHALFVLSTAAAIASGKQKT